MVKSYSVKSARIAAYHPKSARFSRLKRCSQSKRLNRERRSKQFIYSAQWATSLWERRFSKRG